VAKGQVVNVTLALTHRAKPTASGTATAGPAATGVPVVDPLRTPLIVGGATLTGIGIGVGIGTMVAAFGAGADANKLQTQLTATNGAKGCTGVSGGDCQKLFDTANQQSMLSNVAVWSFVGAAGVGVVTVVYALVTRGKMVPAAAAQVLPVAGPAAGGLVVRGRW
jgi:hypothetical protein